MEQFSDTQIALHLTLYFLKSKSTGHFFIMGLFHMFHNLFRNCISCYTSGRDVGLLTHHGVKTGEQKALLTSLEAEPWFLDYLVPVCAIHGIRKI